MNVRRPIVLSLALGVVLLAPAPSVAANDTVASFSVSGSPFAADLAPLPTSVELRLDLDRRARVTVTIRNPNGRLVRLLARDVRRRAASHTWHWDGRRDNGAIARDGRYVARVVVRNGLGKMRVERPLRKGLPRIYPANPGSLAILVDAGHGGRYAGAIRDGFAEKDFNLDIALQLQALLEHAGVQVVMTRSTDRALDEPPTDHNGDGLLNRYDDDLLRNDTANLARIDVGVHVHNNASTNPAAHGTKVFVNRGRSFASSAETLASLILREEVAALEAYRSADFAPRHGGVHSGWYYYLAAYDPAGTPPIIRPSLGVSVLSESLYVSSASELEALKQADVRLSIAAAIYIGLADHLNTRAYGIGYEAAAGPPTSAAPGESLNYRIRVTNRGNVASSGWTLRLGVVPGAPVYDGSGQHGAEIGEIAVPGGLAPGASVEVDVNATAPSTAGEWLVKADVVLGDGTFLSDMGVVALQLPLATVAAP